MFERYSEKARRVIFFARYEASQSGSPYIEPEHMMLALLREGREWLFSASERAQLTEGIAEFLPRNPKTSTSVDLPLSSSVKLSLVYAAEEAELMNQKIVDVPHLLLGLLRVQSSVSKMLRDIGVSRERIVTEMQSWGSYRPGKRSTFEKARASFDSLVDRLTPEIEPATVFHFRAVSRKKIR